MAFRQSCHRPEGHSTGVPHSLHAAGMRPFSDHHLARGQGSSWSPKTPRHGLGDGGQEAKAEARGPKGAAPSHRPPPIPGPRLLPAGTFSRAGGTESRINAPQARGGLCSLASGGAGERGGRTDPPGPPGAARARLVALETPETPLPARSPGALSAPASRPAGPRVPRGSRSRAAAWCRRRGGYGARCLTRPQPPLRARGSRARRPAAFGPAWEP